MLTESPGVESVTVLTAATTSSRDEALWAEEIAGLTDVATTLEPTARAAVLAVLESLANDPTESRKTHRDAQVLLDALDIGITLGAVPHTDDAHAEPRSDGHGSGGLATVRSLRGSPPARQMGALAFATRSFTPLAFQPRVARLVTVTLSLTAGALWLVTLPAELSLALA